MRVCVRQSGEGHIAAFDTMLIGGAILLTYLLVDLYISQSEVSRKINHLFEHTYIIWRVSDQNSEDAETLVPAYLPTYLP